eukprot:g54089.t1
MSERKRSEFSENIDIICTSTKKALCVVVRHRMCWQKEMASGIEQRTHMSDSDEESDSSIKIQREVSTSADYKRMHEREKESEQETKKFIKKLKKKKSQKLQKKERNQEEEHRNKIQTEDDVAKLLKKHPCVVQADDLDYDFSGGNQPTQINLTNVQAEALQTCHKNIKQQIETKQESAVLVISKLITTVYYVAITCQADRSYPGLLDLQEHNGAFDQTAQHVQQPMQGFFSQRSGAGWEYKAVTSSESELTDTERENFIEAACNSVRREA